MAPAVRTAAQTERPSHPIPVGSIEIVRHEVFDEPPTGFSAPYRLGNTLHVQTRERVVRRELLFSEGDPSSPELVAQTERNLRTLPFLRDARIDTTDVDSDGDGVVDHVAVRVQVWDTWSLTPQLRFERFGDSSVWEAGAADSNVLGWGKHVAFTHQVTLDRSANRFLYRDPQLVGSRLNLDVSAATLSDGDEGFVSLGRPFYSLEDPWAFAVRAGAFTRSDPLYRDGIEVARLRHIARGADLELARGFRRRPDRALRVHLAYRTSHNRVSDTLREFGVAEVGIRSVTHRFVQLTHLNRFERTEDVNLGPQSYASIGLSVPALGGQPGRVLFVAAGHRRAVTFGPAHFLIGSVAVSGRHEPGAWANVVGETRVRYLRKHATRHLLIGQVRYRLGHELDPEVQLLLGAESGLRGYPVRRFEGTRSLLLSAEERWFVADDIAQLVSFGLAVFIDSGFAWPDGTSLDLRDLKTGVGGSVLLGSNRLSSVPGIRLDFGYGLNRVPNAGGWVVNALSSIEF
jgi:hypothetical protein